MRPKKIYINGTATFKENGKTYGSWGSKPSINVELNEYTDLSQVWHDATEHPATDDDILIEHEDGFTVGWYGNTYHDEGGFVVKKPDTLGIRQ